ncbi:hypothetical protein GCM10009117_00410 [Gangjinia marincola]|uniref:DUF493 domain-containing protein n=1 Tax=Gangjinia marincola TaxID=578463 RepID=A0ABP3XNP5_9FLAO
MPDKKKSAEFYKKLHTQLEQDTTWPAAYLYKFIVTKDAEKIKELEEIFDNMGAVITTKDSAKGTYTSVSVNVRMNDPGHVIEKYKEVGDKIKDVISL